MTKSTGKKGGKPANKAETAAAPPPARMFYAGVFLLSGLLMALQVLQSRIFSVTTWYHLSFLVISVAMFGLTLGALHVHKGDADDQRRNFGAYMSKAARNFGSYAILGLAGQMLFPIASASVMKTLTTLPLISFCTVPSYYYAGYALSLAMTRAPFPAARTYGFDLLGAALGCLVALALMNMVDAPTGVMLIAAAGGLCAFCFAPQDRVRALALAGVLCFFALVNTLSPRPFIYPLWVKNEIVKQSDLSHDEWNSISRVVVETELTNHKPFLWGPSPTLPKDLRTSFYYLKIDGDAGTPINKFGGDCAKGLEMLDYDISTIAYALPNLKKSGIIGIGGGRDVLTACKAGIRDITAMDVNNIQVSLLTKVEPFRSYANVDRVPGAKLIHSEARSWFASHPDTFDIIQMSLIDTWASTGAGAFALSENGLYTTDAWKTFISRLNPGGVLTVSRWYISDAHSEMERLASLASGALFKVGAKEPGKHIFLATSQRIATLVLARDPFTPAQLDALEKRVHKMKFDILLSPRQKPPGGELSLITAAASAEELEQVADASLFDVSPPTDRRPFFFNQVRVTDPGVVFNLVNTGDRSGRMGGARAVLNLYIIILFSALMVSAAIIWPMKNEIKATTGRFVAAGTAWFALIGLGFMLIEISLLQRLSVYLGHPAYGLSIVLFSLMLSTGAGSMLCDRVPLKAGAARAGWALLTAFAAVAATYGIDWLTVAFADAGLVTRASLSVCVTAPLGILLGFGFPTGMAMAREVSESPTAWFWGINGAAGVMGGAIAIALNIAFGIDATMMIGALCYLALAIPATMVFTKKRRA